MIYEASWRNPGCFLGNESAGSRPQVTHFGVLQENMITMKVRIRAELGQPMTESATKATDACICGEWTEIESYNDDEAYDAMLNRFYEQHPKCRSWHIYFDYDEEENTKE